MLPPFFFPPPTPPNPEFIDMSQVIGDVYPALNASAGNDLIFWSATEIYNWFDEAVQRLSHTVGCFVDRDTTITPVQGTPSYFLQTNQVATVQVDLGGTVLRPRTIRELEAADANWTTTVGPPQAYVQEGGGVRTITLYPNPNEEYGVLGMVLHYTPATISASTPLLNAPTCARDYFTLRALGEARQKETKAAMPEVAAWYIGLSEMLGKAMQQYWGNAQ